MQTRPPTRRDATSECFRCLRKNRFACSCIGCRFPKSAARMETGPRHCRGPDPDRQRLGHCCWGWCAWKRDRQRDTTRPRGPAGAFIETVPSSVSVYLGAPIWGARALEGFVTCWVLIVNASGIAAGDGVNATGNSTRRDLGVLQVLLLRLVFFNYIL